MEDLIKGVRMFGPDILHLSQTSADLSQYTQRVKDEFLEYPIPKIANPSNWFMPDRYKNLDIEAEILNKCITDQQLERASIELELYKKHDMLDVLRCVKYIVDTLRENEVVWGVGRGSSVASYVLFLLGVHKIDSIKYNLPIEEFFKENDDGQSL